MQLQHLRNATVILGLGAHRVLVDPMLADVGAMPGFKLLGGGRRRNPLVPLPAAATEALAATTAAIVTHEHPDHVDAAGRRFLRERGLPVWTNGVDGPSLRKKGLDVHELRDGALGMRIEVVRSRHARGALGWLLGPVCGYYLAHDGEPSIYLIGDSILTDSVLEAVDRLQPDVILAPAGAANMGIGGDILFSVDDLVRLTRLARGQVVFNHLEALDHCPTTRTGLLARLEAEGLGDRVHVPADGEVLTFERPRAAAVVTPRPGTPERPGLQKWVSARFAGA
ncbi:MAG: MBL fold metallo-hydrolase [Deltaproteobacteria bacterium]|nr:MBL fold metallo-hydrolase [Deltaproteobacteria bacterium]